MQVVKTDKGYISGTVIGEAGNEVSVFRGIPYAAPPVGDLRWKPPQPVVPWPGIKECTRFSGISPQINEDPVLARLARTEDCLYLNVLTPAKNPSDKLPVLVWMHGGGYFAGCGNEGMWNGSRLPQKGVVVVTLNHRLGPIGLMAHSYLTEESPDGISGNYLFLDLIASLKWIQNNIAAFGGDPKNVTIFGESGGGAKVAMMMVMPQAKGLFQKAICESGTSEVIAPGKPLAEAEKDGAALFEKLGVKTLEEARKVPWEKILEAGETLAAPNGPGGKPFPPWDSAIDGKLVPQKPMALYENGAINAVPFIACSCLGELTGPGMLVIPFLIPAYGKMMRAIGKAGFPRYAAIFDQVPAHFRRQGVVSFHAIELPYIFGDWDNYSGWWGSITMSPQFGDVPDKQIILGPDDKTVSGYMMEFWTSFAKNGKPEAKGTPDWPVYTPEQDKYMYIAARCEVRGGYSKIEQDKPPLN